ncbi:carbohydrate kinase family protein [Rhodococcus sp. 14-2483-1-1]|uniref:carbohydrate kinase family protein n=1 Tax=Rhodococcus sp. 14-2483-1-1 TaxID=2023148 RepID=UPI000B9A851A|nr:PfkB family carbohydrate kinase [Rhodococcus sp. 14-2483-1-1]OZF36522.1 carbohydrate kinase family protein [Rhodococcus sp. 14-2483-1-1]
MRVPPEVLTLGVHILDTLVRPVTEIPDGQQAVLAEQIAMSAAGTAAGTALVLSRLGAAVHTAGVVGSDSAGTFLLQLLADDGVDVSLVHRLDGVQTSASVLPIRPDGSRPALHVIGANGYLAQHVPWNMFHNVDFLHLGGPEFFGPETARDIARRAHEDGVVVTVDSLAPSVPEGLGAFAPALPYVDYLLPNDEQVLGWTGCATLEEGCRRLLELGASCVVATAGASPTLVVTADDAVEVSTYAVDVVDTSGCGDAFSAGFVRGLSLSMSVVESAELGNATAAHAAQGLGTDFGAYDLEVVRKFARTCRTI